MLFLHWILEAFPLNLSGRLVSTTVCIWTTWSLWQNNRHLRVIFKLTLGFIAVVVWFWRRTLLFGSSEHAGQEIGAMKRTTTANFHGDVRSTYRQCSGSTVPSLIAVFLLNIVPTVVICCAHQQGKGRWRRAKWRATILAEEQTVFFNWESWLVSLYTVTQNYLRII